MLGLSPQIAELNPVGKPACSCDVVWPVTPEQLLGTPQPSPVLVIPLVVVSQ